MKLPVDILRRIIGRPVSHFSGSGHKRAVGRVALRGDAIIYPLKGELIEDPVAVSLSDISAETVGMISPRAMMPFSTMIIEIPLAGGQVGHPVTIRCKVMRCSRARNEHFQLGAEFLGLCTIKNLKSHAKSVS